MATTIQTIELPKKARALDTSGNNNHGQIYSGRGLEFDGVTDRLDSVANINTSYGITNNITVACWVKMETTDSGWVWNLFANTGDSWGLLSDGTSIKIRDDIDGGDDNYYATITNLNTWYRVITIMDAYEQKLYINGVLVGSGTDQGTTGGTGPAGFDSYVAALYIGERGTSASYFTGKISDFQLWDTPWTAADVTYDYLNPESLALNRGGTSLTNSNLKIWYPMQDGHRGQQSYILDGANSGLGEELVANGTFDNDISSWTDYAPSTTIETYDNGGLKIVTEGGHGRMTQEVTGLKSGVVYKFSFEVVESSGNNFVHLGNSNGGSDIAANLGQGGGVGTFTFYFTSTQTTVHIQLGVVSGQTVIYDNVSIKSVNDKNHATTVFYGDEMVLNPGFEDEGGGGTDLFTSWSEDHAGAGTIELDQTSEHGGDDCAKLETVSSNDSNVNQTVTVVAGRTYQYSFWSKNENASYDARYRVRDATAAADVISATNSGNTTTDWEQKVVTFVAPTSCTSITVYLYSPSTSDYHVFIDDVSVKEVGLASGWTDADQQLHIPQTALQSYNELAWFSGQEGSDATLDSQIDTGANSWSFSFWMFNFDDTTAIDWIIGSTSTYNLLIDNNSDRKLYYRDGDGVYNALSDEVIPQGEWVHIVVTATGDTSMTAYINGDAQTTNTAMASGSSDPDTQLIVDRFMEGYSAGDHEAPGCITEISYYNDVLTEAEAQDLYNDGKAKSALEADGSGGLVGYWRNNGLTEWKDLKGSNNVNTNDVTETILIPAGVDASRDNQGFIMNRQRDTSSLNQTSEPDNTYGVDLGSTSTFAAEEAFSMTFWAKPRDITANRVMGFDGNDYLQFKDTNEFRIKANNVIDDLAINDPSSWTADEWVHISIVRNPGDLVTLYVNGTAQTDPETADEAFDYRYIGGLASNKYRGQLDNFLIYDDELSAAEVLRNYNAGKGSHRNKK